MPGPLRAIDVREVHCDLTLLDGRTLSVGAERQPGIAAGLPMPIPDWRVVADLDAA